MLLIVFVKLIHIRRTYFNKVIQGAKQFLLRELPAAPGANEPNQTRSKPDRYSWEGISIPDDARPRKKNKGHPNPPVSVIY